ncbi:MAG: DUF2478 domain-containing protein [Magnetovibrionaceae bacterium]
MSETRNHPLPLLIPAGMLYTPGRKQRDQLAAFAKEIKARGFTVGGVCQEFVEDDQGEKMSMVSIDQMTGLRLDISIPPELRGDAHACQLDKARLAEASGAIRRAISEPADLVVIEKFGEQEQKGEGFQDEILTSMAEGLATLVAVPNHVLADWQNFTGGLATLVSPSPADLWRWWGPERLYRDLELAVPLDAGEARRVIIGHNWTAVEGPMGLGIAQSPGRPVAACRPIRGAGSYAGRPLSELAGLVHALNPVEAAIGLAAINAHINHKALEGEDLNGLDALGRGDGDLVVVGRFPGLAERIGPHLLIERAPGPDDYPETAARGLIAGAERLGITASTLVDHGLPGLLAARGLLTQTTLIGPGTPLTPRLHAYGLNTLSGMVITDIDRAVRIIQEGGAMRDLKSAGRLVTLSSEGYTGIV